jgi:hypothetical protein
LTDVDSADFGLSEDRLDRNIDLRRYVEDDAVEVDFMDAASAFADLSAGVEVLFDEDIVVD